MSRGHLRAIATGAAGVALACAAPSAQAASLPSFEGRCDVYGGITFERPITTQAATQAVELRTSDGLASCAGTARYGARELGTRTFPARLVVRGRGPTSCTQSSLKGAAGTLELLEEAPGGGLRVILVRDGDGPHPLAVETTVDLVHALNSLAATATGAEGSSANLRATLSPAPDAFIRCGAEGISSLPFSGAFSTDGQLVGLRPSTGTQTGSTAGAADRVPPVVQRLRLAPRALRSGAPVSRQGFRLKVSEGGTAQLVIDRREKGRRTEGGCRPRRAGDGGKEGCVLSVRLGTVAYEVTRGYNALPFDGKVGRRALTPGRYRATFTVRDAAGNASGARRLTFLVRPRARR